MDISKKITKQFSWDLEKFSLILFLLSSIFIVFCLGFIIRDQEIPPIYSLFSSAEKGIERVYRSFFPTRSWYYNRLHAGHSERISVNGYTDENLLLVTKIDADNQLAAEIIDRSGRIIHKWEIDWFKLWPNPTHLPEGEIPREQPGALISGAELMSNGDLVFNFSDKGIVRINRDGQVVWKLPYITHHSITLGDDGLLWVCGRRVLTEVVPYAPHLKPPVLEDTIIKVTPEGEILKEWSVANILHKNGYGGLLYLSQGDDFSPTIDGTTDILHLNDVEPFRTGLGEGVFNSGDVLVSLRNINTIFVFNSVTEKIKFISTGEFILQHDPDFIDGNTFSVFDNNNANASINRTTSRNNFDKSRIIIVSVPENRYKVFFEGTPEHPFFSNIMGKHQWQPNGNLLITEAQFGRGFEVSPTGEIVWEYVNIVDEGITGNVSEVTRLPIEYSQVFSQFEVKS